MRRFGMLALAAVLAAAVLAPGGSGELVAQTTTATTLPAITLSLIDSEGNPVTAVGEDSGTKALRVRGTAASAPSSM